MIEISLAALRGNRYFDLKSSRWLTARYSQPTLFVQVCQFCRLVQFLDAAVDNGWVEGSQRRITKLQGDPEFRNDAFIGAWINGKFDIEAIVFSSFERGHILGPLTFVFRV